MEYVPPKKFFDAPGWAGITDWADELNQFTTVDRDMFLHKRGSPQPDALNPDTWAIDAYAFSIAANRAFMSRLLMNLATNLQHTLRTS